ncbi:hypothetical protein [Lapidilactobacillus wuchangensis]|uniref:hypothetical protein n=1 Tax=Lapidilactobacillus wuchangensis TaxID=2486001 RepID=UPI000F7A7693|nr:hypothetical protein [Lapidilactobacillus wuchangensis]
MTTMLFTNMITTTAPIDRVRSLLADLSQLALWNRSISEVQLTDQGAELSRTETAINQQESIQIQTAGQQIIYLGQGPRLSYQLIFKLTADHGEQLTLIREEFMVLQSTLPRPLLALVKPTAKKAFYHNLTNLVRLAE